MHIFRSTGDVSCKKRFLEVFFGGDAMIITRRSEDQGRWSVDYVAKHTGMSTEGLRYYDKSNILTIERNTENGRRIYTPGDIFTLMMLQRYRGLGFSVPESERIIFESVENSAKRMCSQEKDLTKQLEHLQLTINEIRNTISIMTLIEELGEGEFAFSVSTLKPFYYFRIIDEKDTKEKASRRKQLVKKWYSLKPAVHALILFDVVDNGEDIQGDTILAMNLEDSRYLRPVDETSADIVQLRESKKCLTMAGKCSTGPVSYVYDAYKEAVKYAKKMNASVDPVFLDDPIYYNKEGARETYYKKLLFTLS